MKNKEKKELVSLWIDKQDKTAYQDSAPASGIRIRCQEGLADDLLCELKHLVAYLRHHYYFPIRCNILISSHTVYRAADGHTYFGIFYDNEHCYPQRRIYPQIAVCGNTKDRADIDAVLFTLLHELSHYFQWYFKEDERRTARSLEIEATKWANYLLACWKNQ